jgi:hypothetical protein
MPRAGQGCQLLDADSPFVNPIIPAISVLGVMLAVLAAAACRGPSSLVLVDFRTRVRPAVGITDRGPVTVKTAASASETGADPGDFHESVIKIPAFSGCQSQC